MIESGNIRLNVIAKIYLTCEPSKVYSAVEIENNRLILSFAQ